MGLADTPPQQRLALVALEIAGNAALVEVVVDEIVRIGVGAIADSPAPRLAAMGLLHLDYVSPKPGQRLAAGRSLLELGEAEHLDPPERRWDPGRDLWLHSPLPHGDPAQQGPRPDSRGPVLRRPSSSR